MVPKHILPSARLGDNSVVISGMVRTNVSNSYSKVLTLLTSDNVHDQLLQTMSL